MRIPSGWAWLAATTTLSPVFAVDDGHVVFNFNTEFSLGKSRLLADGRRTTIFQRDSADSQQVLIDFDRHNLEISSFALHVYNPETNGNVFSVNKSAEGDTQQPSGNPTTTTSPTPALPGFPPTPTASQCFGRTCLGSKRSISRATDEETVQLSGNKLGNQVQIANIAPLLKFDGLPMYLEAFWDGGHSSRSPAFTLMQPNKQAEQNWTTDYFLDEKRPFQPKPSSSNPSDATDSPAASSNGGLPTGAIAGIAVGCAIVGLALIGALVWFFIRRRQRARDDDTLDPYGTGRTRTDELMAEKEANAGVDASPHSPYSDDGGQRDSSSLHHAGAGAGVAVAAVAAHHKKDLSQSAQAAQDVPRSFTPYSDHHDAIARSPSTHAASVVAATSASHGVPESPIPGRATPLGAPTPYAHLVEEGMTEDEIRRLEDEERALDAAIEQSAVRRP